MDPQKPDTTSRWLVFGAAVAALGVSIASVILAATQPGDPLVGSTYPWPSICGSYNNNCTVQDR